MSQALRDEPLITAMKDKAKLKERMIKCKNLTIIIKEDSDEEDGEAKPQATTVSTSKLIDAAIAEGVARGSGAIAEVVEEEEEITYDEPIMDVLIPSDATAVVSAAPLTAKLVEPVEAVEAVEPVSAAPLTAKLVEPVEAVSAAPLTAELVEPAPPLTEKLSSKPKAWQSQKTKHSHSHRSAEPKPKPKQEAEGLAKPDECLIALDKVFDESKLWTFKHDHIVERQDLIIHNYGEYLVLQKARLMIRSKEADYLQTINVNMEKLMLKGNKKRWLHNR